jgi:hypothetical protein
VFFTQANDFSDLKGELKVFQIIFEGKVKFMMAPDDNPFKAMTNYQGEGPEGKNVWFCANHSMYGFQGWLKPDDKSQVLTHKQVRQNIKKESGQNLVKELHHCAMVGGPPK